MIDFSKDCPEYLDYEDDSIGPPMVARVWRSAMEDHSQRTIKTRAEMIAWIEKHRDELRRHILISKLSNPIRQVGSDSTVDIRAGDLSRDES